MPGDLGAALTDDSLWPLTLGGLTFGACQWVALACLPISAFKNVVNVIQLVTACIDVSNCDLSDRAEARAAKPKQPARTRSPAKSK